MSKLTLNDDQMLEILQCLKRGNTVELKKQDGKIVIVEIQRKVKSKTLITG